MRVNCTTRLIFLSLNSLTELGEYLMFSIPLLSTFRFVIHGINSVSTVQRLLVLRPENQDFTPRTQVSSDKLWIARNLNKW
jgi:hypothetical protein